MVQIKEFLPNPIGKDQDGEYIKLSNSANQDINLTGWFIKDQSGKKFDFGNQKIKGGGELVLDYSTTKISLNNNGETLFLYDNSGNLADQLDYTGTALEGRIVGKVQILSPELRNQLFESPNNFSLSNQVFHFQSFFFTLIAVALIISYLIFYVFQSIDFPPKRPKRAGFESHSPI